MKHRSGPATRRQAPAATAHGAVNHEEAQCLLLPGTRRERAWQPDAQGAREEQPCAGKARTGPGARIPLIRSQ